MKKQRLNLAMLLFLAASNIFSQQVSKEEALKTAVSFYEAGLSGTLKGNHLLGKQGQSAKFELIYTGGEASASDYFVYGKKEGGFVIVAGDARMPEQILAYSPDSRFDIQHMPDALRAILDSYSELANEARDREIGVFASNHTKAVALAGYTPVAPLLKVGDTEIKWDQMAPYNALCPFLPNSSNRYGYTGCGATATAQVMRYFGWPLTGTGAYRNPQNPDSKTNTVDYSKQTYHWDLMLPVYDHTATAEQKNEVAKLMAHVGNAIDMLYKTDASGTSARKVPSALINHFRYSSKMQFAYREAYTDGGWFELIKREIDNKRPVIYSGTSEDTGGGHIFVCDGYDSSGKLHYNYGWSGYGNGYFSLGGSYVLDNTVVIGIRPVDYTTLPENEAISQIVMYSPLNCSSYAPALGKGFNVGVQVANYNVLSYTGQIGIALYKDGNMVGNPLSQQMLTLAGSFSTTKEELKKADLLFKNVVIPTGIAPGKYTLRLVMQLGSTWISAPHLVKDVEREINVEITGNTASFAYSIPESTVPLELISPIDVSLAANRATLKFSVRNMHDFYDCTDTDLFILATSNESLVPTLWQRVRIDNLSSGLVQDFEIKDVPVPPGTNVSSCRYYIAYNPIPYKVGSDREVSAIPLMPAAYNFKSCTVPQETVILSKDFEKEPIPTDFTKYNNSWQKQDDAWYKFTTYYACAKVEKAKLATPEIHIADENYVLEWAMGNMYSGSAPYIIYIATDGEEFKDIQAPVYNKIYPDKGVARLNLSEYVGKKIRIAFEAPGGFYYLLYFKLLNIRTPKDISVSEVIMEGAALTGQAIPVKIKVKNHSANNVRKVNASYTIGEETVREIFDTNIPFNDESELTFATQILVKGAAGDVYPVKIHVEQEGEEAAQLNNNDASSQYMVVNFFPRKGFLAYKSTKMACGGCTLSYLALDDVEKAAPDLAGAIELWKDGSFATTDFPGFTGGTTPTFYLNGSWKATKEDIMNSIDKQKITMSPPADITVKSAYASESSRTLNMEIKCRFALPVTGEYKLGLMLIENNVKNIDGEIAGTHPTGEKLVKNHLPVAIIGGSNGSTSTMRMTDPQAKEYTFKYSYDIPEENHYRYRKDNMQVIGVLFGPNGEILNSSLDSHYLKLSQTEGLTFVPLDGYPAFKRIYDVESVGGAKDNYISVVNHRITLPMGADFKFKIDRSADWNGKNFKLLVNTDALDNRIVEEVLYPDANGVYSIENAQKHYFIEIQEVGEEAPSVIRNGGELVLGGSWTLGQLKGLRLDYDYLTSVDMTNISIPTGMTGLNIANPNAIIYVAEAEANVPSSWKNVVKGSKAERIELTDGYEFHNTKAFEVSSVSYSRKYPYEGWNSICLPFDLSSLPKGVSVERFVNSTDANIYFEETDSMLANVPYILHLTEPGEKIFAASNVQLPVSNPKKVVHGFYHFDGTYSNLSEAEAATLYILNSDGTEFHKPGATNNIPSFQAYLKYTASENIPSKVGVGHMDGQEPKFEVKYKGRVLSNEERIEIRGYQIQGMEEEKMMMVFDPEVTNISSASYRMVLKRTIKEVAPHTLNTVCWDACMSPEVDIASSAGIAPGETQVPVADFQLNFGGEAVADTSIIEYTLMTTNPKDIQLKVAVCFIYDGPATALRDSSMLTLSGTWIGKDFETMDLSDPSLTGIDMTGITLPADTLTIGATNPNLLIYLPQGANVPYGWKNVVAGSLADSIALEDGYAFHNAKEFTAKKISFRRRFAAGHWTSGCMPFDVPEIPVGMKVEEFVKVLGDSIQFEEVTEIKAGVPYLMQTTDSIVHTFLCEDTTLPISTSTEVGIGNYLFRSSFLPMKKTEGWVLFSPNSDGTFFLPQTDSLYAFRGHLEEVEPNAETDSIFIQHGALLPPVGMDRCREHISVENGVLQITSSVEKEIIIYGIEGTLRKKVRLLPGLNRIELGKGVYLFNGYKVIL